MVSLSKKIALLLISCMLACQVSAGNYDPLLIRAQAAIFPKIVLLDQGLARKAHDDVITINIVYTAQDVQVAQQLKEAIEEKYGDALGGKKMVVSISSFDNFDHSVIATAYIILQGSELFFKKVVSHAVYHERIVFSYSYADFEYDALISMNVKEKTYIYINKATVHLYGVSFMPAFYKIAKIVE